MFLGLSGSIAGAKQMHARVVERLRHELRHREDVGVVSLDILVEELPRLAIVGGEVDVHAPDPARAPVVSQALHGRRLRVMHHHDVVLATDLLSEVLVVAQVVRQFVLRDIEGRRALQRVVQALRQREERRLGHEHAPGHVEPEAFLERHDRAEQLGHATAV